MEISIAAIGVTIGIILILLWMKWHYSKEINRLKGEVKLFRNANEYQAEAVVVFSADYEVFSANRAARKLLQLKPYEENMIPPKEILLQVGQSDIKSLFEVIDEQGKITEGTIHLKKVTLTIEKSVHHVNLYIDHSKWNLQNSIICVFQDASSEFKEEENLKRLKKIDFLTNLHSQFKANSDINQMIIEAQKESGQLALYILGINNFETLKSTYGLTYTNDLLKKFAALLKVLEADNAFGYRLDCDSFLYVVKDIEGEKDALAKGTKISKTITQFFKLNNKKTYFTFSVGVVLFPDHGKNANQLIDHAFLALAKSKEKLNGTVEIFKKENINIQNDDMLLTNEIKLGLERKEFEVYYQPVIDLETEQIRGAEALIRWNHPRFGLITPARFIHLAELSGLIRDIGDYVLKETIYQHRRWSDYGFKNIEISVNISAYELLVESPAEKLEKLFADYSVDPAHFSFNISEREMMHDIEKTKSSFSILDKIGVKLSISHFGANGSSASLLQELPIHTLKIDHSLLKDIDKDPYHQEMVKAITLLARTHHLKTVAEKIETRGQYAMLKTLGCDEAYGYIFAKPSPVFEFQELLRR